ncbi:MAG: hypothetical protein WCJ64_11025 [Rhodospirillaceae bacterium]
MVAIRKHAPADATAESLAFLAGKIDSMDRRHTATLDGVRGDVAGLKVGVSSFKQGQASLQQGHAVLQEDVAALKQGQAVLMVNQLDMNSKLNSKMDLIISRLGLLTP